MAENQSLFLHSALFQLSQTVPNQRDKQVTCALQLNPRRKSTADGLCPEDLSSALTQPTRLLHLSGRYCVEPKKQGERSWR